MADFQIVIAGFGGQGLLFSGKVLAYAGLLEGRELQIDNIEVELPDEEGE